MAHQEKLEYSQLETGYEFPPTSYVLDHSIVDKYIKAVEETSSLYQDSQLVPPTAVAAYAQAALSDGISLLPGTIHVSQDLQFLEAVYVGGTITVHARVSRKQERGKMRILNIDIDVFDQMSRSVMKGKTSFILPGSD